MTSRQLKDMACDSEEEYNEYVYECHKMGIINCLDIFSWLTEQEMTAQEYRNDAARDDAITEGDNNVK